MPIITLKRSAVTLAVVVGLVGGAAPANAAGPVSTGSTAGSNDAMTPARFSLTVDGVVIGQFSELADITTEVEPVDRRPPSVTLKAGQEQRPESP